MIKTITLFIVFIIINNDDNKDKTITIVERKRNLPNLPNGIAQIAFSQLISDTRTNLLKY